MPIDPSERLEWSEENLTQVVSDLYKEAETNEALHDQLLANPFKVLNERIVVPENYQGGMFAREKNKQAMMFYVPAYGPTQEEMPAGTSAAASKPDFEPICTIITIW